MSALFPSSNGTYLIATANLPNLTSNFSYCCFFRAATVGVATQRIIQLSTGGPTLSSCVEFLSADLKYVSGAINALATLSANTWYFVGVTHNTAGGTTRILLGAVGSALSVTALTGDNGYSGTLDEMVVGNRGTTAGGNTPFNGEILAWKFWQAELSDDEMQIESTRIFPRRTANLNRFVPIINTTNPGTDYSGSGFNMSLTGTLTDSRAMPPVSWGQGALIRI